MNFAPNISEQAWGNTHACLLSYGIKNQICILPQYGGLILYWKHKGIDLTETFETEEALLKQLEVTYPNVKLSPFVCRIYQGQYTWQNQTYQIKPLKNDGHALHGWMYKKAFTIKEKILTPYAATLSIHASYDREFDFFPFSFDLIITYTLHRSGEFEITSHYINTGNNSFPLVDGWHPYFLTPDGTDKTHLQADIDEYLEADNLIPTGKRIAYLPFQKGQQIGSTHWDTCFLWKEHGKAWLTTSVGTLIMENVKGYNFLQIYTPPHRKSIALEPLTGAPDAWNNNIGMIALLPDEQRKFTVRMKYFRKNF
jgi:aldose 1-epimerase